MKKYFILIAVLSAALLSCKKENTDSLPDPTAPDFKLKSHISNSGTSTYKYDASGRRTQVLYSNGSKTEYEYLNGIVNEKNYNAAGTLVNTNKMELNGDGLVVKETVSDDADLSVTYIYNGDKKVVKRITLDNGNSTVSDFFYSNGNRDSIRFSDNGNWNYSEKTTYHTDKINMLNYDTYGIQYYGKSSKNLPKSEQNIFPNGDATDLETVEYELDAKKRVTKATYTKNANIYIVYYTY